MVKNISLFLLLLFLIINVKAQKKPNILLLIADDMGYADLECYGGISKTPNLNNLANNGIRFTSFYAAAPNCSPSRAGLLTGRVPAKSGFYNYRPPGHPMHLRDSEITIAEVLKNKGYQTAHIGKWHLACLPQDPKLNHPQPDDQGFDYSLGTENNATPSHRNPMNFVRNGKKVGPMQGYSCRLLANEAKHWLINEHQKEEPFFLYVAFHEPHAVVASPPELVKKYGDYPSKAAEYYANIENLDMAVGEIIGYLKRNNLFKNTLIVFSSDNGSYRKASNGDLRAVKSYLYDGGIRVPGIFHWKEFDGQNSVIDEPAGFVDIMPTICDLLQVSSAELPEFDGTSILNLLNEENFTRENPLHWFFYRTSPEIAVRVGDYIIMGKDNDSIPRTHRFSAPDMQYIREMKLADFELYNLSEDIGQKNNLINTHPNAEKFKNSATLKLREIKQEGYNWKQLPNATETKKIKTDWVNY